MKSHQENEHAHHLHEYQTLEKLLYVPEFLGYQELSSLVNRQLRADLTYPSFHTASRTDTGLH